MKFSAQEMIFLNSLSDGPAPFGISFSMPVEAEKEKFIADTIQSLKGKNIVDSDAKLSKLGVIPVKVLEIYKNAKEHIIFNHLFMCRTADNQFICIVPVSGEYDMFSIDPSVVLLMALKQSSFMCGAQEKDAIPFQPQKIDYEEWQQSMTPFADNNIVVGKFQGEHPVLEKVYYWDDQIGFVYDFHIQERTQLFPREMRLQLMDILGISYETEELKLG